MPPEKSQSAGPSRISIGQGDLRCEVVPSVGGAVSGLWFKDVPVLRSGPAAQLQSPRQGGCFALLPFSNRVGHGQLHWGGRTYLLQTTSADAPHAIHGVGWQRAWDVVQADGNAITLAYVHQADAHWPFAFTASQDIRIDGQKIVMGVSYCNTHHESVPVGLGWHPYFEKRAGARVSLRTRGRWEVGPDKLPTHRTECGGMEGDASAVEVDNCFDGWAGIAELSDPLMSLRITSATDYLVAYTRPDLGFLALEPVSHVSNALQLSASLGCDAASLGMTGLPPGATMRHEMVIDVAPSAAQNG